MSRNKKYYVVWVGEEPGVYDSWVEARAQVEGFPGARYKAFSTQADAVEAYRGEASDHLDIIRSIVRHSNAAKAQQAAAEAGVRDWHTIPGVRTDAIAVDGACAGNPGKLEYRGVRLSDGAEVFHVGADGALIGTNNIAEYLAMIHVAALLAARGDTTTPIYTDSRNTLAWLRKGHSNTSLARTAATAPALDLLARADAWLAACGPIRNPILKWDTERWGEIPADFGRK